MWLLRVFPCKLIIVSISSFSVQIFLGETWEWWSNEPVLQKQAASYFGWWMKPKSVFIQTSVQYQWSYSLFKPPQHATHQTVASCTCYQLPSDISSDWRVLSSKSYILCPLSKQNWCALLPFPKSERHNIVQPLRSKAFQMSPKFASNNVTLYRFSKTKTMKMWTMKHVHLWVLKCGFIHIFII